MREPVGVEGLDEAAERLTHDPLTGPLGAAVGDCPSASTAVVVRVIASARLGLAIACSTVRSMSACRVLSFTLRWVVPSRSSHVVNHVFAAAASSSLRSRSASACFGGLGVDGLQQPTTRDAQLVGVETPRFGEHHLLRPLPDPGLQLLGSRLTAQTMTSAWSASMSPANNADPVT